MEEQTYRDEVGAGVTPGYFEEIAAGSVEDEGGDGGVIGG